MSIKRLTNLIEELSEKNDKQIIIEVNNDKEIIGSILTFFASYGILHSIIEWRHENVQFYK